MKEEGDDSKQHKGLNIEWNEEICWFGDGMGRLEEWPSDLHPMPGLLEGMASNKFRLLGQDDCWVYMLAGLPLFPPGVDSASGTDQELLFYRWFAINHLYSFDPTFFWKQPTQLPRPHTFAPNSQHQLFNRKEQDGA